jgi:putrescine transport system ATP-binding protein
VALRPEKLALSREPPVGEFNRLQGTVQEMSYFGSFTVYRLALASGAALKVSMANTQRHSEQAFARGDTVWAYWGDGAAVLLTQ